VGSEIYANEDNLKEQGKDLVDYVSVKFELDMTNDL